MQDQPILCVVHIPKTAGSAIRETLISILGWEKVYWIGHKRPIEHWSRSTGSEFDDYAVVGGHAMATNFSKIKKPKIFMSVVRDPVKRALSLFNYITRGPDPDHGLRKKLQGLSLVEAIQASEPFRKDIENRQCAFIGGAPTFPAALRSICEGEWFIDYHEAVDELFVRVCERFGWPRRKLVLDNVGREGYADEYLADKDAILALKQINQEDTLLVSLFGKDVIRRSDPGAGPVTAGAYLVDTESSSALARTVIAPVADSAAVEGAVSIVSEGSADQLITAVYKAVLGRSPDPSGLQTYRKVLRGSSLRDGVEQVIRGLLASSEFQNKRIAGAELPNWATDAGVLSATAAADQVDN